MTTRTCPNDPSHKRFYTTVHVTEEWLVDEQGDFIEVIDTGGGEAVHGPNHGNPWTCAECGCSDTILAQEPVPLRSLISPMMQKIIDLAAAQGCLPTDPAIVEELRERGYLLPENPNAGPSSPEATGGGET